MKKVFLFILIMYNLIFPQNLLTGYLMEILPQTQNFDSEYITFTIEPQNTIAYCKSGSQWSSDSPHDTSLTINANYLYPPNFQLGYGFDVCYSNDGYPKFWLTVNKITISYEDNSFYFYIDYRDCGYGAGAGSNDITVRTDRDWGFFISSGLNTNVPDNGQSPTTCGFSEISLGQVIRIGEINSYESYETDCMDNYWSNCLVLVNDNWNPHIVWGAHPTFNPISGYKI